MTEAEWVDVGAAEEFKKSSLREAKLGDRFVARIARPVVPIARDAAVIAQRIVERTATKTEVVGFGLPHGVEQLEARDIGVTPCRNELDLRVEQFLLGIEDV